MLGTIDFDQPCLIEVLNSLYCLDSGGSPSIREAVCLDVLAYQAVTPILSIFGKKDVCYVCVLITDYRKGLF